MIDFCNQTAAFFLTVTTQFTINNIVAGRNDIVINGIALFISKENIKTQIASCDLYHFEKGLLKQITSYCIEIKPNN